MLLYSQYIQMICAFVLAMLFATHIVKVWHILTLSFVVGVGQSFGGPAYSALLPTLVGPEDLANAISMNSIQFNLARIIGPTLGGLAYTVFGATWCFALNGVSYVAVILSLLVIRVQFIAPKTQTSVLKSMKEGIRFIQDREGLTPLVVLAFCTTLFGFSLTGFAVSKWLPVSCFLIFLAGAAVMASASLLLSLVQLIVVDSMRGRVMSVYNLAFRAGIPLGALSLGKLIPILGVPIAITGFGLSLVGVASYFLIVMTKAPTFRRQAKSEI
jgi:predicted MFS family arabinose efflux permease